MTFQNELSDFHGDAVTVGLYLMSKPDEGAARALHRAALQARGREGLVGRATDPDRLHLTLVPFMLGDDWLRQSKQIEAALKDWRAPVFRASVDRIHSFKGGGRLPLVATSGMGLGGFHELRAGLVSALDQAGVEHFASKRFNPHVTLLRDPKAVVPTLIEPASWEVRSVQLVLSVIEARRHIVLSEWALSPLAEDGGAA